MSQQFKEKIQQWVAIDTQLKHINEKTKEIRNKKTELVDEISQYVQNNKIQNTTIEITDGSLKFCEKKEYSGLTYSYIEDCLGKIIADKKHVEHIMTYLKENRPVKTSFDIRRNYKNKETDQK